MLSVDLYDGTTKAKKDASAFKEPLTLELGFVPGALTPDTVPAVRTYDNSSKAWSKTGLKQEEPHPTLGKASVKTSHLTDFVVFIESEPRDFTQKSDGGGCWLKP